MKIKSMFASIMALILMAVLIVPAGARPSLPESGMAKKRTVSFDVFGFFKAAWPSLTVRMYSFKRRSEHKARLRRSVPQQ